MLLAVTGKLNTKLATRAGDDFAVKTRHHRIATLLWHADTGLDASVDSYVNLADRTAKRPYCSRGYHLADTLPAGGLTLPGAYEMLKTLPEFARATEC
jgi:hypothetical protein